MAKGLLFLVTMFARDPVTYEVKSPVMFMAFELWTDFVSALVNCREALPFIVCSVSLKRETSPEPCIIFVPFILSVYLSFL